MLRDRPEDILFEIRQALVEVYGQIDKKLRPYLKRGTADSLADTDNQISLKDFISAYKQAYAEMGFEMYKTRATTIFQNEKNRESETRYLSFAYKKRDPYGGIGLSTIVLYSQNSNSCPCYVYDSQIGKIFDELSDKLAIEARSGMLKDDDGTALPNFIKDLEKINYKARELAAEKLAK